MNVVLWDRPIRAGGNLIFGPLAAKEFMATGWSETKNGDFAAALTAILAAIRGKGSPDFAREHFEKALVSAELI
ncbi:DUF982 domain-containing protein [Rhizobium grahamii]|uniref:DUF982 domain-containing protein n=1 Tax=Rhizobium grahamii TaxID=1120045 RepID=UPI00167B3537|nr:DUF982 domain-containing protein [Rhizobium grahamii]